jgi:phage major head subunit gpT-like protein
MGNAAKYEYISDKEVIGLFFQAYEGALENSWVPLVSSSFTSNTAVERYAGIGNAPALREWVGGRLAKSLAEYSKTVTNKDYEATLVALRKDLKRDKTGQLQIKIADLAQRAAEHDEKLLSALIDTADDGDIETAYDGQYFFDTDHSVGSSGTIDNDITVDISALPAAQHGSITAPSPEEFALSFAQGVQQMRGFKDDQGEPINHGMNEVLVMVPVGMETAARAGLFQTTFAGGASNPIAGWDLKRKLIVNPRLTWTDEFAIFRIDSMVKPLIVQVEEAPVMEVVGEGSEYAFDNAAHKYGVRKSGAVSTWDFCKGCLVTLL